LKQFEAVRDFLYLKMRGVKDAAHHPPVAQPTATPTPVAGANPNPDTELAATLREVTQELRALRLALETKAGADVKGPGHV
jgi:putative membrane protein